MDGIYTPQYGPEYTEVTYDGDGVYINASGGTTLNISWATLGFLPDKVTILGALITWAWPMAEWTNGAVVAINNFALNPTNLALQLTTTCSQRYMLRIRVLYMRKQRM